MRREPVVAGQFYPFSEDALRKMIEEYVSQGEPEKDVIAAVSPHAGYMYSGPVAGFTYAAISEMKPKVIAIIGPDHTGAAMNRTYCYPDGEWETPLGVVETVAMDGIEVNENAHAFEHSIEVQVPFLQYIYKHNFKISPIIMGNQSLDEALLVGERIKADLVIASSDFSHYVPYDTAVKNDLYAIEAVERMDEKLFYERIYEKNVTACGYGPITAAMHYAKLNRAKQGKLLKYATSGDVTGDKGAVVGYASIIFKR